MEQQDAGQFHFDPDTYLEMVISEIPSYEELQDRTAEATVGVAASRILDLGAGTGETAVRVARKHPSAHIVGIDESVEMLAHARLRLPAGEFRVGRLEDPLPSGQFDLVVSALAVHHLDGPGKQRLFNRIAERLARDGRFVMADVVVPDDPADVVTPIDGVYDKPSRVVDLLTWLGEAGFDSRVAWSKLDLAVIVAELRSQPSV
jgi:tRNA (cmo5U34)-methyltransferase